MKIGIDCRIYSSKFTGIGRYVYELIHRIAKLDKINTYVLFFNNPEFIKENDLPENFKKILIDAPIYSLKEQTVFLKTLNKEKLDLMHFTHFNAPIFYNKPSIVTIHDLTLSFYPGKKNRSLLKRIGYNLTLKTVVKKAKKVITISQNSKQDLIKILKTPEEKIKVIYQGVGEEFKVINDQTRIDKTLLKYNLKNPFLLYTGVWRSHKNVPRLIEAFHKIRTNFKVQNLKLAITGKEDPFYPEITNTANTLNEKENIIFTGLVNEDELIDLYNAADIYVFPSLYEGFGLPPLEAMACKTPVAVSQVSSIPEICGKGNSVFFNPESADDIAQRVYALYKNKNLQAQLIKNGEERVKQFTWRSMAENTFNVYKSCLSN
ncbi:glycosyltransferase family 4 protein [bacterium]|nr:glycosyltransferase family 4 protein [bacterium]